MCRVSNSSCCSYTDETGRIKKDLAEIWKRILGQVTLEDDLGFENNNHITITIQPIMLTLRLANWTWITKLFIVVVFVINVCTITWCMFQCCSFWSSLWATAKYK